MHPSYQKHPSELALYIRALLISMIFFGICYGYTAWLKIPNVLNKATADTAIFIMGLSMLLSSICYFFNFLNKLIVYRKYLGLVGFAFGLAHIGLSFSSLQILFRMEEWAQKVPWSLLSGLIATVIFAVMALISNRRLAMVLGGKLWRYVLRTGYLAVILIGAHVVLLKYGRWVTWYAGGMKTPPSSSLLITLWIVFVVVMRLLLWLALRRKSASMKSI